MRLTMAYLALLLFALTGYTHTVTPASTSTPTHSHLTVVMPLPVDDYLPNPGIGWQESQFVKVPIQERDTQGRYLLGTITLKG
jgi:hypothetical protein